MSETESYSSEESYGWISWFCNLEDHQFFCKVDEEYIRDSFNLYGLKNMFDHYKYLSRHSAMPCRWSSDQTLQKTKSSKTKGIPTLT